MTDSGPKDKAKSKLAANFSRNHNENRNAIPLPFIPLTKPCQERSEESLSGEFKSEIRNRIAAKEHKERKERSAGVIAAGKHLDALFHSGPVRPSVRSLAANFSNSDLSAFRFLLSTFYFSLVRFNQNPHQMCSEERDCRQERISNRRKDSQPAGEWRKQRQPFP